MSLSGSERSSQSCDRQSRQSRGANRQRKLFRKRDKHSRSSERYEFSDLEDDVFVRGPRKLRRQDVEGELSYDYTNPGRLKVFTAGLNRCAGQPEFRTVLVSASDTAADIINEVLQRCDILYNEGDEFFLCEVIGKLEPYQNQQHHHPAATQFVEQCRRIIGPEEHVLVIQALWKPLYGYFRRFELKQVSRNESKGLRSRRKRFLRVWRSGTGGSEYSCPPCDIDGADGGPLECPSGSEEGQICMGCRRQRMLKSCQAATQVEPGDPARSRTRGFGTQTETVYFASADRRLQKKYPIPLGPYLLLLKGFDSRHDLLVNDLFDTNLLGSDDRLCDVHLRCADVQPEHCIIEACHSELEGDSGVGGRSVKPYCMSVAPIGRAEVLLNGQLIDRKHFLSPGDVISIGAAEMCSYVFMFKDASQIPDRSVSMAWLMFLESAQRSIDLHQLLEAGAETNQQPVGPVARPVEGSFVSTTVPSDSVLNDTPRRGYLESQETEAQQLAQASLGSLLALYFGEALDLQFAAGLIVLIAVYVTDLELEQASSEIQWHITDSVVTLSKKATQMQDLRDKAQCYAEMIQACALAFEIFLFFHETCKGGGDGSGSGGGLTAAAVKCQQWRDFCESTMQQMLDNIFCQLGEEVLTQSAALCDVGLSSPARRPEPGEPTMESFITLLTQVSQAFSNAQYQCVSTLRLMVMKRLVFQVAKNFTMRLFSDDPATYLKWNCAVQLRVNLDQLEEWLRQEGLERFLPALDLPNSLVDMVATPKSHLVTMPWQALRNAFPLIPANLMRRTLSEYESRSGPVSGIWRVSPEDQSEASYSVTCAVEDHFQSAIEHCQIPVEEVRPSVQLLQLLDDSEFVDLTKHLDQQTGARNCHLKWHHVATRIRERLSHGRLFSNDPDPSAVVKASSVVGAASVAAGAGASTSASPNFGGVVNSTTSLENEDEALYYDSLTEDDTNSEKVTVVKPYQEQQVEQLQKPRPKTPTPVNPFAAADPDIRNDVGGEDEEEASSSLVDSFTLANTIRNETLLARNQLDTEDEVESESVSGAELYNLHTRSFVVDMPPTPLPPVTPAPSHQPPPPPPRSESLNGRRTAQIQRQPQRPEKALHGRDDADVFQLTLTRSKGQSFGMELIDGEKTPLSSSGVFIRSLAADTPAGSCGRLHPGDRIVAVNGQSLTRLPYAKCLSLIKRSESVLHLQVARPKSTAAAAQVLATVF